MDRSIIDNTENIKEQKDYYPFGEEHENPNLLANTNRYTFSGKEKQTVRDLGWLDFSARMLINSEVPMWTTQDPLAEKYYSWSPYNYCGNNPINRIDPNGMDWYSTTDKDGNLQYHYDANIYSQKDVDKLKKDGAKYLGMTYTDGDTYYSLFGQKKDLTTTEGQLYKVIDNGIIEYANTQIKNLYPESFTSEWFTAYSDMKIRLDVVERGGIMRIFEILNQYNIEYEGSFWGHEAVLKVRRGCPKRLLLFFCIKRRICDEIFRQSSFLQRK
jgi:RHS repeat-associated protein